MRIEKLQLLAYGPFRGLELDLGAPGLHVVFGRNEAGKSTTLRAITGLLYGIDRNTPDAHVHKPTDLRIGGVLAGETGERIRVVRRKGNTNTLLDPDGQPVAEAVLARLLRGVPEEAFRTAFGLDHPMLQKGAEALLEGKGDLGESLFDASVGGGGEVQRLLKELAVEAERLYKPKASNPALNEALRAFNEAQKQIKDTQSLPEAYVRQEEEIAAARADKDALVKQRADLAARRQVIDRARVRVPLERRRGKAVQARAPLARIEEAAVRIKALDARRAAYERAAEERRQLLAEATRLRDRVAIAARRAGVEAPDDALRLDARKEALVVRLVAERSALEKRVADGTAAITKSRRDLERLGARANDAPPEASALSRALEQARKLGDAEARLGTDAAKVGRWRSELAAKAAQLGDASVDALAAMRVPAVAAVDALAVKATEADRVLARVEDRLASFGADAAAVERQIAEQTGDFAPPSAAELRAARSARDEAFATFRASGDATPYERAVREADDIADRMIREADRVTLLASKRSLAATLAKQIEAARAERDRARVDRAALDAELASLLAPAKIEVRGFAEVRAWLEARAAIAAEHARLREAEGELADATRAIDEAKTALRDALVVSRADARLAELVDEAARRVKEVDDRRREAKDAAQRVTEIEATVEDLSAELAKDEAALATTRERLGQLLAPLGVALDASAAEVDRAIEALRELFEATDLRADVDTRLAAVEVEVRAFEEDVAKVATDLAPDLAGVPAATAAATLASRSEEVLGLAREIKGIDERLAELGDEPVPEELLSADPEALVHTLDGVDAEIEAVEQQINAAERKLGGLEVGLKQMQDESGAADASVRAQEALARVRTNVEAYARVRIAHVILSREIDRYREENQGPLLGRASQFFARLTLGSFSGIRAGFDDKDRPALRCVRPHDKGGGEVDVTGLSEGTRDQLYLSLRLASLLRHAELGGPMPLVLDDVLIQYDDERSRAALGVLAEVARSMQVLFFTHHARLVELARSAVAPEELVVHELAQAAAATTSATV